MEDNGYEIKMMVSSAGRKLRVGCASIDGAMSPKPEPEDYLKSVSHNAMNREGLNSMHFVGEKYNIFSKNRGGKQGSGVMLLVRVALIVEEKGLWQF